MLLAIRMPRRIPTNVITGFLGTGKTTAVLDLLARKPAAEKWAVLVNEFGEIGVDGALLAGSGAEIREVPGGCMCCVAGLPMKVALNNLIMRVRPDRLLIEPTGLGHPQEIVDTLTGEYYGDVLDLRAVIALVDPRRFSDTRYTDNLIFNQQLRIADVIVANKTDLCDDSDRANFDGYIAALPAPLRRSGWIVRGQLDLQWLELPHAGQRVAASAPARSSLLQLPQQVPLPVSVPAGELCARRENRGDSYRSCGWLFAAAQCFDFQRLMLLLGAVSVDRLKAVLRTERGSYAFNAEQGTLSVNEIAGEHANVIELIHGDDCDWQAIEAQLRRACIIE